jgi:4-hydroxybenzoate polyprenyltransferase
MPGGPLRGAPPARRLASAVRPVAVTLEMIKFQHTLFALPFALTGMALAARGWPGAWTLAWVIAAMVGARSAAMTFNRIADRDLDARNPRTAGRALPAGRLSLGFAWGFTLAAVAVFVTAAAMLNPLCLLLSPAALAVALGYSLTKRFTTASHFVLGLALAIAPVGGWLAVRGAFAAPPLLLAAAVLAWTAGFDLLYACQDIDFDRREGLFSLPARLGPRPALRLAAGLHALTVGLLGALAWAAGLGAIYLGGLVLIAALLAYEHALVSPGDLRRLDVAFFRVNAWVSVLVLVAVCADLLVPLPPAVRVVTKGAAGGVFP